MIFLFFYSLIPFLKKIEFIVLFLYMYSGLKFFFFFFYFICFLKLFIQFWLRLVFAVVLGLLDAVASLIVEHGLKACRLSRQAYLPCSMWDIPGPGIEPLHWQVDFFTTAPLGKSLIPFLTIWLVV